MSSPVRTLHLETVHVRVHLNTHRLVKPGMVGAGETTQWVLGVTRWVLRGSLVMHVHTVRVVHTAPVNWEAGDINDRCTYVTANIVNLYFLFTHSQVLSPKGPRDSQELSHNVLPEYIIRFPNRRVLTPVAPTDQPVTTHLSFCITDCQGKTAVCNSTPAWPNTYLSLPLSFSSP